MYYSSKTFNSSVLVRFDSSTKSTMKTFNLNITVYCRSKTLGEDGCIINLQHMEQGLKSFLDTQCLNDVLGKQPTLEILAEYICEQIIPCYKVKITNELNEEVIYEESEE